MPPLTTTGGSINVRIVAAVNGAPDLRLKDES